MTSSISIAACVAIVLQLVATTLSVFQLFGASARRTVALVSSVGAMVYFASYVGFTGFEAIIEPLQESRDVSEISAYAGILFNFIYCVVFIAFGDRVFAGRTAGYWLVIQGLVSLAVVAENTELFSLLMVGALLTHLKVSQADVYQVTRKQDRYVLVVFCSIVAVIILLSFFGILKIGYGIDTFSQLASSVDTLPRYVSVLSSMLMMILLGAFPLHFWVRPLFAAPARYGLAVITRLQIGFVVWCKLYPFIFAGDHLLEQLLTFGCGANLLYAGLLLFGERKLSNIVSALYLYHVPLLILAVRESGKDGSADFVLDFANITVALSGLLIILGMLRDRLGAENLDRASGLGLSYPFLGVAFLVCVLSLVGFPGTLGFISSEVILHHFAETTWLVAVCFIITLALNGYSSFRIFGESFYGDPVQSFRRVFQPVAREKLAIMMVLLFLFCSGIGPHFLSSGGSVGR